MRRSWKFRCGMLGALLVVLPARTGGAAAPLFRVAPAAPASPTAAALAAVGEIRSSAPGAGSAASLPGPAPAPVSRLTWEGPPDCGEPAEGLLPSGSPSQPQPRVSGTVRVARAGARWTLELTVSAPVQGRRMLTTGTCADALAAARLLVRLAAGGALSAAGDARPETALDGLASPPLMAAPEAPQPSSADGLSLFALGGARLLALPAVEPRSAALLWMEGGPAAVAVALGVGLPERFLEGPAPGAQVQVQVLADAVVGGCAVWRFASARLAGCVDGQLSWWRLRGLNVSAPREGDAPFAAVGPAVRLILPAGDRWRLMAGISGRLSLVAPRASFGGDVPAVGAGLFSVGLELGLGFRAARGGGSLSPVAVAPPPLSAELPLDTPPPFPLLDRGPVTE